MMMIVLSVSELLFSSHSFLLTSQHAHILEKTAMEKGLGGNPFGPAGTGKTETVKALGHQLGRLVLVFNCDEALDVRAMTRILVGLIKCGAWGCFDEFNRLSAAVLSALSVQIHAIQTALKDKSDTVTLPEFGEVDSVSPHSAIFITLNPMGAQYKGRNQLPENLTALFSPVAMSVPDNLIIARVLLLSEGFSLESSEGLGQNIITWFDRARKQMSEQKHYDWGLRAIKSCLTSSGRLLRSLLIVNDKGVGEDDDGVDEREEEDILSTDGDKDDTTNATSRNKNKNNRNKNNKQKKVNIDQLQEAVVVQCLRQQIKSKLVEEDEPIFDSLTREIFSLIRNEDDLASLLANPLTEKMQTALRTGMQSSSLTLDPYQVMKALELDEQLKSRLGVVILGESGVGKTTIWQMLSRAKREVEGRVIHPVIIGPKAMPKSQLLGHIDEETREWNDGVLPMKAREIARDEGSDAYWIVMDGDIDPDWVEALNSVLDDNQVLTLPSGERIDFDRNKCNILFEVTSLQYASPATISRLGKKKCSFPLIVEEESQIVVDIEITR